jgi:hypothetical protein
MKRSIKFLFFSLILLTCATIAQSVHAQAPPPPPAEKGANDNKAPGGGAPIDGGVAITLALVAGLGAWKLRKGALK